MSGCGGEPLEELGVLRIRERVAALDEIEAQLVEPPRDEHLVLQREVDPLALGAVAERRVVKLDLGHACLGNRFMVIYSGSLGKTLAWRARFRLSRASTKSGCDFERFFELDDRLGQSAGGEQHDAEVVANLVGVGLAAHDLLELGNRFVELAGRRPAPGRSDSDLPRNRVWRGLLRGNGRWRLRGLPAAASATARFIWATWLYGWSVDILLPQGDWIVKGFDPARGRHGIERGDERSPTHRPLTSGQRAFGRPAMRASSQ